MKNSLSLLATLPAIALILTTSLILSSCGAPSHKNDPIKSEIKVPDGIDAHVFEYSSDIQDAINQKQEIYIDAPIMDIVNMDSSSVWGLDPVLDFYKEIHKNDGTLAAAYKTQEQLRKALRADAKSIYEVADIEFPHLFRDFEDFKKVLCIERRLAIYYSGAREGENWVVETVGYTSGELLDAELVYFVPKRIWQPQDENRPTYINKDGTRIIECELVRIESKKQTSQNEIHHESTSL